MISRNSRLVQKWAPSPSSPGALETRDSFKRRSRPRETHVPARGPPRMAAALSDRKRLTAGNARLTPFWICPDCGNLLQPKENKAQKSLRRFCRHCNREDDADSNLVLKTDLRKEAHLLEVAADTVKDPTLPHAVDTICASCGHNESVFFQAPTRGDEGMKLIFMCTRYVHPSSLPPPFHSNLLSTESITHFLLIVNRRCAYRWKQ